MKGPILILYRAGYAYLRQQDSSEGVSDGSIDANEIEQQFVRVIAVRLHGPHVQPLLDALRVGQMAVLEGGSSCSNGAAVKQQWTKGKKGRSKASGAVRGSLGTHIRRSTERHK